MRKIISMLSLIILLPLASAHCPLCTVGAGAAAGAAVWLGVSKIVVALFVGAFAMSMGMWFAKLPKKRHIPFQRTLIILGIFLTTVFPLLPVFSTIGPLYLSFAGEYGKTYAVNYALAGSFLGGIITFISPGLNVKIKEKRGGKGIPFQGILITFGLLIITALIIQFIV